MLLPQSNKSIKAFQTQGAEIERRESSNTNQLSLNPSIFSLRTPVTEVHSERKRDTSIEEEYNSYHEEDDQDSSKESPSQSIDDFVENKDSYTFQITVSGDTVYFSAIDESDEEQKSVSIYFL